jgi:hypothetical protein
MEPRPKKQPKQDWLPKRCDHPKWLPEESDPFPFSQHPSDPKSMSPVFSTFVHPFIPIRGL